MSKDAVVVCLDVGPAMARRFETNDENIDTCLKVALSVVSQMVLHRLRYATTDEMAIVLFGTRGTKNQLADAQPSEYRHVTVARDMGRVSLELMRYVESKVEQGTVPGDYMDALVVGMDLLLARTSGKVSFNPRMFIITDGRSPINWDDDQADQIIASTRDKNIDVQVIGVDANTEPVSDTERRNREILSRLSVDPPMSFAEAIDELNRFRGKSIRQTTTYRGTLDIGGGLKLPVWTYIRVAEKKAESFANVSKLGQAEGETTDRPKIQREKIYKKNDDDGTEVAENEKIHGYKYGVDVVPVTQEDEENMKLQTHKSMQVIGFAPASKVPRYMFMGGAMAVMPPQDDPVAMRALSALIHALHETSRVAIVRYVFREKANVKLGGLYPYIRPGYECLLYVQLPFAEDIRQPEFASFEDSKKTAPTDEQLTAASELIESMDLIHCNDPYGETSEAVQPKHLVNPSILHFFEAVHTRAMDPEAPLPVRNPELSAMFEPPSDVVAKCEQPLSKLKGLCPISIAGRKRKAETAERQWGGSEGVELGLGEAMNKRQRTDTQAASIAGATKDVPLRIGTVDPVGDFEAMLSCRETDLVLSAVTQMCETIERIVEHSFGDRDYDKAMHALEALRRECIKNDEVTAYNDWLRRFKQQIVDQDAPGHKFWQRLVGEGAGVSLIHDQEQLMGPTGVTQEDAELFLKDAPIEQPTAATDDQPDEDLMAELE